MSLSVRTRFEVFKRDQFTCQYCGKHPPDVLLEADHVIPRAAGGSDAIENLTTACADCNRGKADRLLEEGAPTVTRAKVDDLRERVEQASAYAELVGQQQALVEKQVRLVTEVWAQAFKATVEERSNGSYWVLPYQGEWPNERSVRLFVRRLPLSEIVAAVDLTASRHPESSDYACRFFYKVCWRRIKGESGPIDEPRQKVPETTTDWESAAYILASERDDAEAELEAARHRIEDLEDEVRDLRAIIATYQEKRSGGWEPPMG